jgi:fructoselysine-6-P-deglycase FrlB-like protein
MNCKSEHGPDLYKSIVLCGVGLLTRASASACDIINDIIQAHGKKPAIVVRGHDVPSYVDRHTLALINSASGNT